MTGPIAAAGMQDAAARIATIQARIAALHDGVVGGQAAVQTGAGPAGTAPATTRTVATPAAATTAGTDISAGFGATTGAGTDGSPSADLAARLPEHGRSWAGAIESAAREAGVDPALFAALVQHESNFDPDARSHAGAIGLAQLMPGTAEGLGVDPTDPQANLAGGARYLRQQLDRFGSTELALAAYNAGPNRVVQAGGVPRIPETLAYVDRVMSTWEQLR